MAQLGRAPGSGPGGRGFKSHQPDSVQSLFPKDWLTIKIAAAVNFIAPRRCDHFSFYWGRGSPQKLSLWQDPLPGPIPLPWNEGEEVRSLTVQLVSVEKPYIKTLRVSHDLAV